MLLHLVANIYQFICFPIYGIPKVSRKDYIVMDRNRLRYLNQMERFNCLYCEYVNGLLAYVQEIRRQDRAVLVSHKTCNEPEKRGIAATSILWITEMPNITASGLRMLPGLC